MALKWAVTEKFKDYLWGAKFTAFTDNNPLVRLNTATLGAVEQRWAAQLANFQFELKYRLGVANKNADVFLQEAAVLMTSAEEESCQPEEGRHHHKVLMSAYRQVATQTWKQQQRDKKRVVHKKAQVDTLFPHTLKTAIAESLRKKNI
ncbi:hypothetical protein DPEC_G00220280 [Dallia pectoralis]|uniref:Uncharacterized protein n=1 Tax=Dallia pectoralis TaxID=75939 RepID=A0ACC2G3S5_DALPE|nr:hypothetical protein DPEC_G00220280 [Dallia pectoralis]